MRGLQPPVGHQVPPARAADRFLFPLRLLRVGTALLRRRNVLRQAPFGSAEYRQAAEALLRALGIRVRTWNSERLPHDGAVVVWNHASLLDPLILSTALPLPFRAACRPSTARRPWARRLLRQPFALFDPAAPGSGEAEAVGYVRSGGLIMLSPLGARSWDTRILPMDEVPLRIALEAGRPIAPVLLHGAQQVLPRGRLVPSSGTVDVEFLPPLDSRPYADRLPNFRASVTGALRGGSLRRPSAAALP